jgi:hypothetical protein
VDCCGWSMFRGDMRGRAFGMFSERPAPRLWELMPASRGIESPPMRFQACRA